MSVVVVVVEVGVTFIGDLVVVVVGVVSPVTHASSCSIPTPSRAALLSLNASVTPCFELRVHNHKV